MKFKEYLAEQKEDFSKYLSDDVYKFIKKADKDQLMKMKKELKSEIEKGLLKDTKDHSYTKELEFINYRLQ